MSHGGGGHDALNLRAYGGSPEQDHSQLYYCMVITPILSAVYPRLRSVAVRAMCANSFAIDSSASCGRRARRCRVPTAEDCAPFGASSGARTDARGGFYTTAARPPRVALGARALPPPPKTSAWIRPVPACVVTGSTR